MNHPVATDGLLFERTGRVMRCTLNRPEVLNAISMPMHHGLEAFFRGLRSDRETDVVVLTGAGRAFSAGGDVNQRATPGDGAQAGAPTGTDAPEAPLSSLDRDLEGLEHARSLVEGLLTVPQPIIAMVNGDAVGLAATLALFCDIVVAAEQARFGDPHVRIGIVPGDGGAVIWPLLVGVNRAKEYLMTGNLMSAAEAERMGLANHVVPMEKLEETVDALTRRLTANPAHAVRWTKRSVNKTVLNALNLAFDLSLAYEALTMGSEEHHAAVRAFLAKSAT